MIEWLRRALDRGTAEAFAAHESGDWARAHALLEPLAREHPDEAAILYRLGDALYQLDRLEDALPPLERATQLAPGVPAHHYKLGNVLKDLERPDEALACYRRALDLDPRHAQALNNTGAILEAQGKTDEAIHCYRQAILANGALEPAHNNLALLLHRSNRFAEAVDAYRALLEVTPRSEDAWCNLGNAYVGLERFDDAIRCYRSAIGHVPESALAHYRLGVALLQLDNYREAEAAARRAVEIAPDHVDGWINLGDIFQTQKRHDEALAHYEHALTLAPKRADLLNNIGVAYKGKHALETAFAYFEKAIESSPGYALARMNHAGMLLNFGEVAEARAGYRRILESEPKHEQAARQLLLCLLYQPVGAAEFFAEHLAYGKRFGSNRHAPAPAPHPRPSGKKLRIGYVSSDLRRHPVGYNVAPLMEFHDRNAFEIYLYSHLKQPDDLSRLFQRRADAWRSIANLSDEAVARQMREDRLDILVLLAGRFDENRPLLARHRPAPVQVSMHDPATSGLAEVDYLIADRSLVPRGSSEKFTERVACLPTFYVHPHMEKALSFPEPPCASQGRITFGSFNNPAKINEPVVALWARVLDAVPGSRLRLKHFDTYTLPRVRSRHEALFRKHGIAEDRLLLDDQPLEDRKLHLARYAHIDIALDTFPFTGSTTTFEALWMGVPVVTLAGSRMVARWSTAMLRKVGLSHLIATDEAQYVEIARQLASDTGELARLRASLRERVARSPLCAERARTRQLERLYRRMWAIHVARRESRVTGHESTADRPSSQR